MASILHIDDDHQLQSLLRAVLEVQGHEIVSASDGREGFARFQEREFDLAICDIQMPVMDGLQVLEAIMNDRCDTPVIMATSVDEIKTALNALKIGAFDYVVKPFTLPVLAQAIQRALAADAAHSGSVPSEADMSESYTLSGTVAVSEAMRSACDIVRRVAPFRTPHLITGETGTGRTLLARAIHGLSDRCDGPFIRCSCERLASGRLEQPLLFLDHATTADGERRLGGMLIDARDGTLLLEDIEALPLEHQDCLLRVILDGVVGLSGSPPEPCDVRVLATTRQDLRASVECGELREELVSLLTIMPVVTTPLRARIDDILPLTWHFLLQLAGERDAVPRISRGARAALEHYSWPGNTGELFVAVQHAFRQCQTGNIEIGDFPSHIVESLEGLDIGRGHAHEESQQGQVFRERLAKTLADQLKKATPPRARHVHRQHRKPELSLAREEQTGAYDWGHQ